MHRDIRSKTFLFFLLSAPKAAVCGYGKATKETLSEDTRIGPIPLLSPEVRDRCRYDRRIDIWNLAYI